MEPPCECFHPSVAQCHRSIPAQRGCKRVVREPTSLGPRLPMEPFLAAGLIINWLGLALLCNQRP
jgi:hypothetical protein